MTTLTNAQTDCLHERATLLKLYGLLAQWDELSESDFNWVTNLLQWEETARNHRSLERRLSNAKLGRFKMLADFDWRWPTKCDRGAIEDLMKLSFLNEVSNAILVGPNGVGKTMVAKNIGHTAVLKGHKVLFTTAAKMLNELAGYDGNSALQRRLRFYAAPELLIIDEVGYLSYGNRHADLLFEVINSRYEQKSTMLTTNRPFSEWGEVFPGAACVVSLIDRLVHNAEIVVIEAESYRLKEAKERSALRQKQRNEEKNG
jgi:DNA replication protein DnaC